MKDRELREGDFYHFHYHPKETQGWDSRMHCFEGLLRLVRVGDKLQFRDTFWGISGSNESRCFTIEEARTLGKLTFYCNINDIEKIGFHECRYYKKEDVFCLHKQSACYESCRYYYKRKGATRDKDTMLQAIANEIEEETRNLKRATNRMERLNDKNAKVENGDLSVSI